MAKTRKASKAKGAKQAAKARKAAPQQKAKASSTSRGARRGATGAKAPKRGAKAAKTAKSAPKSAKRAAKSPAIRQARQRAQARTAAVLGKKPNLDRERRTIRQEEEEMVPSPPSSLNMDRTASSVRTGRQEYEQRLREHTSTGPAMTGGDVDADWEDAEMVGDEAPGGDNPTPDQDVVDEIGRAMGIEYDDDEELKGGDELVERDRHRWELDPASKDDFDEE
jgi:hypothetical protein